MLTTARGPVGRRSAGGRRVFVGWMGGCFGYRVQSDPALLFTRDGAPEDWPVLRVTTRDDPPELDPEPLLSWGRDGTHFAEVYRSPDRKSFAVNVHGGGWFHVRQDPASVAVPVGVETIRREERLWGLPALLCFLARGDIPLQAAAVETAAGAVVLAGPTRSGKSTLAAAALGRGWRVLSDDLTCIRPGSPSMVLPGPAALRLRTPLEVDPTRLPGRTFDLGDGRVHLSLAREVRGSAAPVPVRALVLLHPGDHDAVTAAPDAIALRDMWALSFRVPELEERVRRFDQLADLVRRVPVLSLSWDVGAPDHEPVLSAIEQVAAQTAG
jgi:hypothetical protein